MMSSSSSEKFTEGGSLHFMYSVLPAYNSPLVELHVVHQRRGNTVKDSVFLVPEQLLCENSRYFASQLEENRRRGKRPLVTLWDKLDYVSRNSVACLLQWLYQAKVVFDSVAIQDEVMAVIDVARLANKCEVYGLEEGLAARIKRILIASTREKETPDDITSIVRGEHMSAASKLPLGHPVRRVMAAATVPAFIGSDTFYLWNEVTSTPSLAMDLLEQLQPILRKCKSSQSYEDPLTGAELDFPDWDPDEPPREEQYPEEAPGQYPEQGSDQYPEQGSERGSERAPKQEEEQPLEWNSEGSPSKEENAEDWNAQESSVKEEDWG